MKKITSKILLAGITTLIILSIVSVRNVLATTATTGGVPNNTDTSYTLLEPLPNLESGGVVTNVQFKDYVQYFFNLIIALSAAAAVFMIVLGGFQYMTTDSWQGKSEGIDKVKNALIGLLVVLSSYLLLRTIDPRLVEIPSTLVKPLQIQYSKVQDDLMKSFVSDINKFKFNNIEIMNNLDKNRSEMTALDSKNKELAQEIRDMIDDQSLSDDDIKSLCADYYYSYSMGIDDMCLEMDLNSEKKRTLEVDSAYQTGKGLINAVIQECYGLSGNASDLDRCNKKLLEYTQKYNASLKQLGSPDKAKELVQYMVFGSATVEMFDAIQKNIPNSATSEAIIDTLQTSLAVGGTVAGGAGGVAGGVVGFALAEAINGAINQAGAAVDKADAIKTANAVIDSYNKYIDRVTDENVKTQLVEQTNSILKGLNVTATVDGTKTKTINSGTNTKKENYTPSVDYTSGGMMN